MNKDKEISSARAAARKFRDQLTTACIALDEVGRADLAERLRPDPLPFTELTGPSSPNEPVPHMPISRSEIRAVSQLVGLAAKWKQIAETTDSPDEAFAYSRAAKEISGVIGTLRRSKGPVIP